MQRVLRCLDGSQDTLFAVAASSGSKDTFEAVLCAFPANGIDPAEVRKKNDRRDAKFLKLALIASFAVAVNVKIFRIPF